MGLFDLFKKKKDTCNFSKLDVASPGLYEEPTERQLSYARDLGIIFPDNVSKDDISCLISRANGDDHNETPAPDMVELALKLGVNFSPYVSSDRLLRIIFYDCTDAQKGALYAYAVYQRNVGKQFSNMFDEPHIDTFIEIGEHIASDKELHNLLNERPVDDLASPRKGTKIYNAVSELLNNRL